MAVNMANDKVNELSYDWVNSELFQPIIEKELNLHKKEFDIKINLVKPAVGVGENYLAQVTRTQIEVTRKNEPDNTIKIYNFIIKSSMDQISEIEILNVFEKEMEFYNNVVQNIGRLDDTLNIAPKCFLASNVNKKSIIILEDLSAQGFAVGNRHLGLDLEHCKLYYIKLAAFHAITACYLETTSIAASFTKSNFDEEIRPLSEMWNKHNLPVFKNLFKQYDSLKQYYDIVKDWDTDSLFNVCQELTKVDPNSLMVLNHGDSWVNNMMFSYDENEKPNDIRLLDFQITSYGTPLLDIFIFFMSSPNLDVRENNFDELIRVYHDNLVVYLKKHNYTKAIPTLRELHIEILKKGFLAANFSIGYTPIVLLEPKNAAPLNKLMEDSECGEKLRHAFHHNPLYIKTLEVVMKFLHNRGFLEM